MSKFTAGIDIVDLKDFARIIERTPAILTKLFHENEIQDLTPQSVAGKFAAKEALIKAGVIKPGCWLDVFVDTLNSGKPVVRDGEGNILENVDISISHTRQIVTAIAIYEK